jgi:hypothetical protein
MENLTREYVNNKYSVTLTDSQWRVVSEEMVGEPDSDSIAYGLTTYEQVLDYVIDNLDSLEQDYLWWDNVTSSTAS